MTASDNSFREEFKPLVVPASYEAAATEESKIIFALAQIGEGSTDEVVAKLEELEPGSTSAQLTLIVEDVLSGYYDKGLLKGSEENGEIKYNLSKITEANEGEVNPDLLAPGLD